METSEPENPGKNPWQEEYFHKSFKINTNNGDTLITQFWRKTFGRECAHTHTHRIERASELDIGEDSAEPTGRHKALNHKENSIEPEPRPRQLRQDPHCGTVDIPVDGTSPGREGSLPVLEA